MLNRFMHKLITGNSSSSSFVSFTQFFPTCGKLIVSKTYSKHIDMRIGFESKCRIDFLPASISLLRLNYFNVLTFKCAPITSHEL